MEVVDKCDDQNAIHDGTGLNEKWSKSQVITKIILAWQKRSGNVLKLPLMLLFKAKELCSLNHRPQNSMIRLYIK